MKKVMILILLAVLSQWSFADIVTGLILNSDDTPDAGTVVYDLTGKRLEVYNNKIMMAQNLQRAISNFDGKFAFKKMKPGKRLILARDMQNNCSISTHNIEYGSSIDIAFRKPARLTGTFLAGDKPIADTEVNAILMSPYLNFRYYHQAVTDSKGRFKFKRLMPGKYQINVVADVPQVGCCFRTVTVKQTEVDLKAGGSDLPYLAGKVIDRNEKGLHGVWVSLFAKDTKKISVTQSSAFSAVTDRDGNYTIYDIPPGDYSVQCFRRLAENNASRVMNETRSLTIPKEEGKRTKNTLDITIDKEQFLPLRVGQLAPAIGSGGEGIFDLKANHGKIVVLHFYASWCKPCIKSMGDFDKLQMAFGDEVVVLGISLDESVEAFNAFIVKNPGNHQHLYGGPWKKSKSAKAYRVINIPTSVIIGPNGRIIQLDLFGKTLTKFIRSELSRKK